MDADGNPIWDQDNGDANFCIADVNRVTIDGFSIPSPVAAEGSVMAFPSASVRICIACYNI